MCIRDRRHTPSSLGAVIGLSNNDVTSLRSLLCVVALDGNPALLGTISVRCQMSQGDDFVLQETTTARRRTEVQQQQQRRHPLATMTTTTTTTECPVPCHRHYYYCTTGVLVPWPRQGASSQSNIRPHPAPLTRRVQSPRESRRQSSAVWRNWPAVAPPIHSRHRK